MSHANDFQALLVDLARAKEAHEKAERAFREADAAREVARRAHLDAANALQDAYAKVGEQI